MAELLAHYHGLKINHFLLCIAHSLDVKIEVTNVKLLLINMYFNGQIGKRIHEKC